MSYGCDLASLILTGAAEESLPRHLEGVPAFHHSAERQSCGTSTVAVSWCAATQGTMCCHVHVSRGLIVGPCWVHIKVPFSSPLLPPAAYIAQKSHTWHRLMWTSPCAGEAAGGRSSGPPAGDCWDYRCSGSLQHLSPNCKPGADAKRLSRCAKSTLLAGCVCLQVVGGSALRLEDKTLPRTSAHLHHRK